MSPDLIISAAAKAIIAADRPAGLHDSVTLRTAGDITAQQRPDLVFFCENGTTPHPQLHQTTLVARLRVRDDENPAADASTWLKAAVDYFRENPAALAATLAPHGLNLQKFTLGPPSDNAIAGRATEYDQRWKVWVKVG